jgi:hypothetical protein
VSKPRLKLVQPGRKPATTALGPEGKKFFDHVQREYGIEDAGGLSLLIQAARCLDRAEACRQQIEDEGMLIDTKIGPKEHPLLKSEQTARSLHVRCVKELGIALEPKKAMGRPTESSKLDGTRWTRE